MADAANENARPGDETGRAQGTTEGAKPATDFMDHGAESVPVRNPSFAEHAQALIDAGLTLLPLNGKTPRDGQWQRRRYDSAAEVAAAEGRRNLGVRISGTDLLVVDADPRNYADGVDSFQKLVADCGIDLESYPVVRTGGGGFHVYMRRPAGFEATQKLDGYPGIDIKTSGQVVAPGSIHPETGAAYVGERMAYLALETSAPAALLDLVRRDAGTKASTTESGAWTPEELAQNLAKLDPDDFATYDAWREVMMASHHATNGEGLDEFVEWSDGFSGDCASRQVIEEKWRGFTLGAGGITHALICKLLHERGERVHDELPAELDFDAVEDDPTVDRSVEARWRFLSVEELEALPPPRWLVPGLFVEGSIAAIYGAPESGKSFLAVDVALAVASGIPWHGREVAQGATLYVAAEGAPGLGKRVRAWRMDKGATTQPMPFVLMRDPLNLTTENEARDFAKAVASQVGELRMIVVDTLNQTATGADENSAQDMGRYIAGMKRLRDATGATVVVVHHSGKDETRGMRGSTALLGAMDTTVEVARATDGKSIEVRVKKQKDAERDPPMRFNMEKVGGSLVLRATMMADAASDFGGDPIREMAREMADGRGGSLPLKDLVAALRERDGVSDKTARRRIAEVIPEGSEQAKKAMDGRAMWTERADGNPRGEVIVRIAEVPGCHAG